jgi:cell division protein FtsB
VRRFLWIPALLGAATLYSVFDDGTGIRTWLRLAADLRTAQENIAALRLEVAELRREAAALESDPVALERAIREDLEYARPGEVVVRLPSPPSTNARIP